MSKFDAEKILKELGIGADISKLQVDKLMVIRDKQLNPPSRRIRYHK
jgi:hypothetical protein